MTVPHCGAMSFPDQQPPTGSVYVPGPEQQHFGHPSTWPPQVPPTTPPPRRPKRWILAAVAGLAVAIAAGGVALGVTRFHGGQPAATQASPTPTWSSVFGPTTNAAAQPPAYTPTADDFKLTIKVLEKQCFGSAGCNITFRIELAYSGRPLSPSRTYEITYRVDGTDEAEYVNTLTVTGEQYRTQDRETVSTKSSKSVLTVVVTAVNPT